MKQSVKPTYTLADLEKELAWESPDRKSNLGKEKREQQEHHSRLLRIRTYLIADGQLEPTESEKLDAELDRLYPNAKSRSIVEYNGKRYQIRYYPVLTSNTGKTVYEWGHTWWPADD